MLKKADLLHPNELTNFKWKNRPALLKICHHQTICNFATVKLIHGDGHHVDERDYEFVRVHDLVEVHDGRLYFHDYDHHGHENAYVHENVHGNEYIAYYQLHGYVHVNVHGHGDVYGEDDPHLERVVLHAYSSPLPLISLN